MCNTDYDYARVYRQDFIRARKKHYCSECGGAINPGFTYQYTFGAWDKKPSIFKTCIDCCVPQKWLSVECGGYLHGGLREEVLEHAQEYRKMFLYRWVVEMDKRRRNKDIYDTPGLD